MAVVWIDGFRALSWGWILTGATSKGLCACHVFGAERPHGAGNPDDADMRSFAEPFVRALFPAHEILWEANEVSQAARQALTDYLHGSGHHPQAPLDWIGGTPFERKVWQALCRIPYGTTVTYGDIARQMGCPQGARAVGQACGKNPTAIVVPCHRVVGRNGSLGGYSGGIETKKALLRLEGIAVGEAGAARRGRRFP